MSSGTGTSINQPYNTSNGGIMSQPYTSSLGGNMALYESGSGAISSNYAPNINAVRGGRRQTKRKKGKSKQSKSKRRRKSKKSCSLCQRFIW